MQRHTKSGTILVLLVLGCLLLAVQSQSFTTEITCPTGIVTNLSETIISLKLPNATVPVDNTLIVNATVDIFYARDMDAASLAVLEQVLLVQDGNATDQVSSSGTEGAEPTTLVASVALWKSGLYFMNATSYTAFNNSNELVRHTSETTCAFLVVDMSLVVTPTSRDSAVGLGQEVRAQFRDSTLSTLPSCSVQLFVNDVFVSPVVGNPQIATTLTKIGENNVTAVGRCTLSEATRELLIPSAPSPGAYPPVLTIEDSTIFTAVTAAQPPVLSPDGGTFFAESLTISMSTSTSNGTMLYLIMDSLVASSIALPLSRFSVYSADAPPEITEDSTIFATTVGSGFSRSETVRVQFELKTGTERWKYILCAVFLGLAFVAYLSLVVSIAIRPKNKGPMVDFVSFIVASVMDIVSLLSDILLLALALNQEGLPVGYQVVASIIVCVAVMQQLNRGQWGFSVDAYEAYPHRQRHFVTLLNLLETLQESHEDILATEDDREIWDGSQRWLHDVPMLFVVCIFIHNHPLYTNDASLFKLFVCMSNILLGFFGTGRALLYFFRKVHHWCGGEEHPSLKRHGSSEGSNDDGSSMDGGSDDHNRSYDYEDTTGVESAPKQVRLEKGHRSMRKGMEHNPHINNNRGNPIPSSLNDPYATESRDAVLHSPNEMAEVHQLQHDVILLSQVRLLRQLKAHYIGQSQHSAASAAIMEQLGSLGRDCTLDEDAVEGVGIPEEYMSCGDDTIPQHRRSASMPRSHQEAHVVHLPRTGSGSFRQEPSPAANRPISPKRGPPKPAPSDPFNEGSLPRAAPPTPNTAINVEPPTPNIQSANADPPPPPPESQQPTSPTIHAVTLANVSNMYRLPIELIKQHNPAIAALSPNDPLPPTVQLRLPVKKPATAHQPQPPQSDGQPQHDGSSTNHRQYPQPPPQPQPEPQQQQQQTTPLSPTTSQTAQLAMSGSSLGPPMSKRVSPPTQLHPPTIVERPHQQSTLDAARPSPLVPPSTSSGGTPLTMSRQASATVEMQQQHNATQPTPQQRRTPSGGGGGEHQRHSAMSPHQRQQTPQQGQARQHLSAPPANTPPRQPAGSDGRSPFTASVFDAI